MSRHYDNPGSRWLAENDPDLIRKGRQPRRAWNSPRRKPARETREPKDALFQRESKFLMSLPQGSHWEPHQSGDGVVVRVPGQAPFWRKSTGAIVK